MEEALSNFLLGASGLTALVGQRITWGRRPQASAFPSVVLTKIDALPDYTNDGPSGLVSSRIQIDCFARDASGTDGYGAAKQVARQVSTRLSGVDAVQGGVTLRGGFQIGERDFFERGQGGAEIHRVSLDFTIWHSG